MKPKINEDMLTIPVEATYSIIDGVPVLVSAEYRDISADAFAKFLLNAFHVPFNDVVGDN